MQNITDYASEGFRVLVSQNKKVFYFQDKLWYVWANFAIESEAHWFADKLREWNPSWEVCVEPNKA